MALTQRALGSPSGKNQSIRSDFATIKTLNTLKPFFLENVVRGRALSEIEGIDQINNLSKELLKR